jgi:hypothetical protein
MIHKNFLKAALLFCDKSEIADYISGLRITPNTITATDKHRILRITTPTGCVDEFTIPYTCVEYAISTKLEYLELFFNKVENVGMLGGFKFTHAYTCYPEVDLVLNHNKIFQKYPISDSQPWLELNWKYLNDCKKAIKLIRKVIRDKKYPSFLYGERCNNHCSYNITTGEVMPNDERVHSIIKMVVMPRTIPNNLVTNK